MRRLERGPGRRARSAAVVVAGLALCALPLTAEADPPPTVCVPLDATGAGQDLGRGQTQGVLLVGGDPIGTTTAVFTLGDGGAFTGPLTFVPDQVRGSRLTIELSGTFAATGDFSATSTSVTGKGQLNRVTGSLRVIGHENLQTGAFTETLVGQLCAPANRIGVVEGILG